MFEVEITVPGTKEWCDETHAAINEWRGRLAASEHAHGLTVMPSIKVVDAGDDVSELQLIWVDIPADGS
jgi:hypothetical protein